MIMVKNLSFFFLVLKQVNAVVVVTISIIHMQNCVFLILSKIVNVRAFNLMSRTNATRHVEWHEMCKCKCKFDGMAVFVIINNAGIKINAGVNAKN